MENEADMSSWTNLLHSSSKLVEQAAPSAQFPPLQRNLDQLEALSKKLKSKTLRTERLLAREGLNAEQLARDLKSFELKTTFEDFSPAEATSVEEYLQQLQVVIENMTTTKDDTFHGFTIEDNLDLANEYKVLKGKHDMLIKKDEHLQSIIIYLNSENATQKKKVELLENEIKELKSQDVAKELSKKSVEEVEDENAKLKVKTLEQKKEINMLTSKVHRLQSEIKQSEENHQSEVKLLETQLNQQKEFVLSADVKNIVDKIKEAHNEMISYMEKAHNIEKSAIRMDGENKVRILLELQKKVQDLNAQN